MATNRQVWFFNELISQGRQGGLYTRKVQGSVSSASTYDTWLAIGELLGSNGDGKVKMDENFNNDMVKEYTEAKKKNFAGETDLSTENIFNKFQDNQEQSTQKEIINKLNEAIPNFKDTNGDLSTIQNIKMGGYSQRTNSSYYSIQTNNEKVDIAFGDHFIDNTNARDKGVQKLEAGMIGFDDKGTGQYGDFGKSWKIGLNTNENELVGALKFLSDNNWEPTPEKVKEFNSKTTIGKQIAEKEQSQLNAERQRLKAMQDSHINYIKQANERRESSKPKIDKAFSNLNIPKENEYIYNLAIDYVNVSNDNTRKKKKNYLREILGVELANKLIDQLSK